MNQKSSSRNLIGDIVRVMSGETSQQKQIPDWIVESAQAAADEIWNSARGRVMTSELKRTIIRRHLNDAVGNCGCEITSDLPVVFEAAVNSALMSPASQQTLNEAFALPSEKEIKSTIKGLEAALKDSAKLRKLNMKANEVKERLRLMKGILVFGKSFANGVKQGEKMKKEQFQEQIDALLNLLIDEEVDLINEMLDALSIEVVVEDLNEAYSVPTEKQLKDAIKNLEGILGDTAKMKKEKANPKVVKDRLKTLKAILTFGKGYAKGSSKKKTKKEQVSEKFDMLTALLSEDDLSDLRESIIDSISIDDSGNITDINYEVICEGFWDVMKKINTGMEYTAGTAGGGILGAVIAKKSGMGPMGALLGGALGAGVGMGATWLSRKMKARQAKNNMFYYGDDDYKQWKERMSNDKSSDTKDTSSNKDTKSSDSEKKTDSKPATEPKASSGGGSKDDGPPACPGNQKMVFGKCRKVGG